MTTLRPLYNHCKGGKKLLTPPIMNKKILTLVVLFMALLAPLSSLAGRPIPGVDFYIDDKVHRAGVAAFLDVHFINKTNHPIEIYLDANPFLSNGNVIIDGEQYSLHSAAGAHTFTLPAGESMKRILYVDNLPYNTKELSSVTVKGSTSVTSQTNPHGEFDYNYIHMPLPSYPESNKAKCYFLDTEFDMTVDKIVPNGKNLEIIYTLTNNGKRDKRIASNTVGKATDEDGDEYDAEDSHRYIFTDIEAGDSARGKIIIKGGANRKFKKIRVMYDVKEVGGNNFDYPVLLQLDGAQD